MAFLSIIFINGLYLPEQIFSVKGLNQVVFTATFVNRSTREVNQRCHFLPPGSESEEYAQESGPEFV